MTGFTCRRESMRASHRIRKFKLHRRAHRRPRWWRETSPNLGLMVRPYGGIAEHGGLTMATYQGLRDFLLFRRDRHRAQYDAMRDQFEADYDAMVPSGDREVAQHFLGYEGGAMDAFDICIREFAGDIPRIADVIDRAIESVKAGKLHNSRGIADRAYFDGQMHALRNLRRELLGDVRTASELTDYEKAIDKR